MGLLSLWLLAERLSSRQPSRHGRAEAAASKPPTGTRWCQETRNESRHLGGTALGSAAPARGRAGPVCGPWAKRQSRRRVREAQTKHKSARGGRRVRGPGQPRREHAPVQSGAEGPGANGIKNHLFPLKQQARGRNMGALTPASTPGVGPRVPGGKPHPPGARCGQHYTAAWGWSRPPAPPALLRVQCIWGGLSQHGEGGGAGLCGSVPAEPQASRIRCPPRDPAGDGWDAAPTL